MLRSRNRQSVNNVPSKSSPSKTRRSDETFDLMTKLIAIVVGVGFVLWIVYVLAGNLETKHLGGLQPEEVAAIEKADIFDVHEASKKDPIEAANKIKKQALSQKEMNTEIENFMKMTEEELADLEEERRRKVKQLKSSGVVMEKDPRAKEPIAELQEVTRALIRKRYGEPPYRVEFRVVFPEVMSGTPEGKILIELAPIELVPHNVFVFLEIVRTYTSGAFNRVAGHVLQTMVEGRHFGLAFQEYHPDFPHKKFTLGYAGRPGGPAWYISTVDNTMNHGPGSQGSKTEADGCFGKVLEGFDVIENIKKHPVGSGFINKHSDYISIRDMKLLPNT